MRATATRPPGSWSWASAGRLGWCPRGCGSPAERTPISCRSCPTTVEESAFANIPPTKTCMNCHAQIWNTTPILEKVRTSFQNETPLQWTRVNDLPDFVYFNHSIHVKQGVGCATCHGP